MKKSNKKRLNEKKSSYTPKETFLKIRYHSMRYQRDPLYRFWGKIKTRCSSSYRKNRKFYNNLKKNPKNIITVDECDFDWMDFDAMMVHCMFKILVEVVERPNAWLILNLDWEGQLKYADESQDESYKDYVYEQYSERDPLRKEVEKLYKWYKEERPAEWKKFDDSRDRNTERREAWRSRLMDKDTEMMKRLIEVKAQI